MGAAARWLDQLKRTARKERMRRRGTAFDYFFLLLVATFAYLALTTLA
jgi:hypothetical protein